MHELKEEKIKDGTPKVDVVLSSGFLAFARHIGFLKGTSESFEIEGICGTSSGAVVGALWASGLSVHEIQDLFLQKRPFQYFYPSLWGGLFNLSPFVRFLESVLPPTFEELDRPFAVGVADQGQYRLLTQGSLPSAVVASCAIPYLFRPIQVDGVWYRDGGLVDRLGLSSWRALRPDAFLIAHQVQRTHGRDQNQHDHSSHHVHTPRSGARLWSLGPFKQQVNEAYQLTHASFKEALLVHSLSSPSSASSPLSPPSHPA